MRTALMNVTGVSEAELSAFDASPDGSFDLGEVGGGDAGSGADAGGGCGGGGCGGGACGGD